jgi:hypothetical protein
MESDDLTAFVIRDGPMDQTRNLEIPGSLASFAPRNDGRMLDENRARPYSRAHE